MQTIQAILFDLDGTLLDTLRDIADAMNAVLARMGFPEHPVDAYKRLVGEGIVRLVQNALPPEINDETIIRECLEMMRTEYGARCNNHSAPYPGISDMLDELSRRALPLAVLSNKPHDFTLAAVDRLLSRWKFSRVYGNRDGIPVKPAPDGALDISRSLSIPPDRFLYLGDTGTDMMTATAAGMIPVGVLWGFRDTRELLEAGAHYLLESPMELFTVIKKW